MRSQNKKLHDLKFVQMVQYKIRSFAMKKATILVILSIVAVSNCKIFKSDTYIVFKDSTHAASANPVKVKL